MFRKVELFFFPLRIAVFCLEGSTLYISFQTHSELQILHKNLAEEKTVGFASKVPLFTGLQVDFLFFLNFLAVILIGNVQLLKIKHDVGRGCVSDEILWMKGKYSYSLLQTNLHRNFLLDLES